jgi:tetratricopeptide (TPR) repeat protein
VRTCFIIALSIIFAEILRAETHPLFQKANAAFERQEYDTALIFYNQLIDTQPEQKENYFNRGLCFFKARKFSEALNDFNQSLRLDSSFHQAHYMKVLILQQTANWKEAEKELALFDTNSAEYKILQKNVFYHRIAVTLSRNWYYMVAIMFLFILIVGVAAKSLSYRKV